MYRLHKSTNEDPSMNGKWYARAVPTGTITYDEFCKMCQSNSTVKSADVESVINEFFAELKRQLQQSHRVKIDGLGAFVLNLRSTGAATYDAYDVKKNVKLVRVVFTEERKNHQKLLTDGVKFKELPHYAPPQS